MANLYSVNVDREDLYFASSHFLLFKNGEREPLHGHNFKVKMRGTGNTLTQDEYLFDFLKLTPIIQKICNSLDHLTLIPKNNEFLKISETDKEYQIKIISTDERIILPKKDVIILPINNTTVEKIAFYMANKLYAILEEQFHFHFNTLEIEIIEGPGESACYIKQKEDL